MAEELKIGPKCIIGEEQPTFIIAEVGQNHQGDINIAKRLIEAAKECGADCVKFQKSCLAEKFTTAALKRPYDSPNSWGRTYGEHKAKLEFNEEQFTELQEFANNINIVFSASAMDPVSLDFLVDINVPFIKIGSGDANNLMLLRKAADKKIPLIISTGMQDMSMVQKIYETISGYHKNFVLLHCVSAYPTPLEEVNLNAITLFKKEFPDISVGYSGHELGIHVSLAAVALGAKVIERHITLDNRQRGSDHQCSLDPTAFKALVNSIRSLETALGKPVKEFQKSEMPCHQKLGKSIVAADYLRKGTVLTEENIKIKVSEPTGINPALLDIVLGSVLKENVNKDRPIVNVHL